MTKRQSLQTKARVHLEQLALRSKRRELSEGELTMAKALTCFLSEPKTQTYPTTPGHGAPRGREISRRLKRRIRND
jgi:hypothetical protein